MKTYKSEIETIEHYSYALKKTMPVSIYKPKNFDTKINKKILYFFHGRTGSNTILEMLNLQNVCDQMILENKIEPFMIVCPSIGYSRGINSCEKTKTVLRDFDNVELHLGRYEDYIIEDLLPFIEKKYGIPNNRFIGGISAGGYTALHIAFNHIEKFSKVGGHMPAIDLEFENEDRIFFKNLETWHKYDPISIAKKFNNNAEIKVFLDAGNKDEGHFYEGCKVLENTLISKNIDVQNYIFKGHHNVEYIISNLEKYMIFYGN